MKPIVVRTRPIMTDVTIMTEVVVKENKDSLEYLSRLQVEILDLQAKREALEKEVDVIKDKYQTRCAEMISILQKSNMDSYNTPYAHMSITKRFTVPVPKGPEAKEIFFNYLKSINEYEGLRTINSQSLNAWYKEKLELAKERGDIDWHPPGLEEPRYSEYLSIRK